MTRRDIAIAAFVGLVGTATLIFTGVSGLADFLSLPVSARIGSALVAVASISAVATHYATRFILVKDPPPSSNVPNPAVSEAERHRQAGLRLVQILHRRWFPTGSGVDLDKNFRVSLFIPEPDGVSPTRWTCLARTTTKNAAACWPHVTDVEQLATAGVVVNVANEQLGKEIDGVEASKQADASAVSEYRARTYIDEKGHQARSWKFSSMLVRVARAKNGTIFCVMVVERQDGLPIRVNSHQIVAIKKGNPTQKGNTIPVGEDLCGWELQLAAEVWATSWERP